MTIDPTRHTSNPSTDADGWLIAACACGWTFGPVPDDETATDVLMEHAYIAGTADALEPTRPVADVDMHGPPAVEVDPDQLTIYDEAGDA